LDRAFYDRYYRGEALSQTERSHMEKWHGTGAPGISEEVSDFHRNLA